MGAATIPETEIIKVERFCAFHVPEDALHQVRLEHEVRGRSITIIERRAPWSPDHGPEWSSNPRAQIRWDADRKRFTLYCQASNDRWHVYEPLEPQRHIDPILAEIDEDPTCIFWG